MAGQGGSASPSKDAGSKLPGASDACTACRKAKCTDYQGLGYNVLEGCFSKVDPQFDARADDPTFIADCTAVVRCAYEKKCGFMVDSADCYCGSAQIEDCFSPMPAANGPCMAEIEKATRTMDRMEVGLRFSDKAYPMGWAADLIDCDHLLCGAACKPQ